MAVVSAKEAEAPGAAGRKGVEVRLEGLRRSYGSVTALDGLDLTIAPGEMVALLGPSGCGKTTALRLLAGLEDADAGRILVGGRDVGDQPPNRRGMGMVFQAYSLFPHMTASENVQFGLRLRRVSASARRARALEVLELVGLGAQVHRYAHQMSGGQQQRVALARALAVEPTVLLLDEPLSALDAKVRVQLRDEIRRIQLEVGTTTLFVTHDQEEALAVADRVGVMNQGRLEQLASPADVYHRPATPFVSQFVGLSNRLPATVEGLEAVVLGQRIPVVPRSGGLEAGSSSGVAVVRPEAVALRRPEEGEAGPRRGTVVSCAFLGSMSRVTVELPGTGRVVAQVATWDAEHFPVGAPAVVELRPDPVVVVPGDGPERATGA